MIIQIKCSVWYASSVVVFHQFLFNKGIISAINCRWIWDFAWQWRILWETYAQLFPLSCEEVSYFVHCHYCHIIYIIYICVEYLSSQKVPEEYITIKAVQVYALPHVGNSCVCKACDVCQFPSMFALKVHFAGGFFSHILFLHGQLCWPCYCHLPVSRMWNFIALFFGVKLKRTIWPIFRPFLT